MNNFRLKLTLAFTLIGVVPCLFLLGFLSFFDEGLIRGLALVLLIVCVVNIAIAQARRLVHTLELSTDNLERLLNGKECQESLEGEIPELKEVRRAFGHLIKEQFQAKTKLESLLRRLESSRNDLQESNAFLEAVFESSPLGILVCDLEGRPISSNEKLLECFDIKTLDSNCEQQLAKALADANQFEQVWKTGLEEPMLSCDIDIETAGKNGRNLHLFSSPVHCSDRECFARVWIVRDDTERNLLNEELLQSQKMEAIGLLAGGIAHDFNNLLTAIRGNLEYVMSDKSRPLEKKTISYLSESFDAAKTATSLVGQILGYSRKSQQRMEPTCLNTIVQSTRKLVGRMLKANIQVETDVPKGACRGLVDSTQVQQILVNLCVNARDAMPQGGTIKIKSEEVTLEKSARRIEIPGQLEGEKYIKLSVSDNGSGISEENLAKIFDPFFTTKPTGEGTGLGLSTCLGIAQQHNGWIECDSKLGAGSTFSFYLPFLDNETGLVEDVKTTGRRADSKVGRPGECVLVIDDEPSVRKIARMSLERKGYHVIEGDGGQHGIDSFKSYRDSIDLVLLDRNMPDLSGEQVFDAISEIDENIPVIICSGFLIELDEFKTERNQIPDGFIQKPYSLADLVATVEETIDSGVALAN